MRAVGSFPRPVHERAYPDSVVEIRGLADAEHVLTLVGCVDPSGLAKAEHVPEHVPTERGQGPRIAFSSQRCPGALPPLGVISGRARVRLRACVR